MHVLYRGVFAACAAALLLAGCATGGSGSVTPKLASESECFASTDPAKCKMAHDLAGGYPFTLGGRNR